MRLFKFCCLWILGSAIILVLLRALSGSSRDGISSTDDDDDNNNNYNFSTRIPLKGNGYPPVFAYWICGTNGDSKRILRLLNAIYHPRNQYLLQLDADSSDYERRELALSVQTQRVFQIFGNVNVVGKSYAINQMGSSAVAATLHAAALLLKINTDWDWFFTLSASDYPLTTQDDLLHAFTDLPRDLNFIDFSSDTGWKERQNINQIVVDPSLYFQQNTPIFQATETRTTPDAFKIFGGSPWVIPTRAFMDYCVKGWDNLPRKLLMYFTNVAYPLESYFHTVLCNSPEFQNTAVDNDLRYIIQDNPTHSESHVLNMSQYEKMLDTDAAFARPFQEGDPVLDKVDMNILNGSSEGVVPAKWCLGGLGMNNSAETSNANMENLCSWGNIDVVKPGSYGIKLGVLLSNIAAEGRLRSSQCHQEY